MQEHERTEASRDPASYRAVVLWASISALAALGFAVSFVLDLGVVVLGALLSLALAALAAALRRLTLATRPYVVGTEERRRLPEPAEAGGPGGLATLDPTRSPADEEPLPEHPRSDDADDRGRNWSRRAIIGAGGALAVALLAPATSLAPTGEAVGRRTRWQPGTRLLDDEGNTLAPEDIPPAGLDTIWPEGPDGLPVREELASVVLIRIPAEDLDPGMEGVADDELVAYSKVCTHMGCPIGLFRAGTGVLFCPCHQAQFDATAAAVPTFGPAERALPQLPVVVEEGVLVAAGDFIGHVGPTTGLRPRGSS